MRARMVCAYPLLPAGLRKLVLRRDFFKDKGPGIFDFKSSDSQGYIYHPNPDPVQSVLFVRNTGDFVYPNRLAANNLAVLNAEYVLAHIKQDNTHQEEDVDPDVDSDGVSVKSVSVKPASVSGKSTSPYHSDSVSGESDDEGKLKKDKKNAEQLRAIERARKDKEIAEERRKADKIRIAEERRKADKIRIAEEKRKDAQKAKQEEDARKKLAAKHRTVTTGIFSFTSHYARTPTILEAMTALNWIASFVRLDREHYCMLQNALPVVLHETEKSIRIKRDGFFKSFKDSAAYLAEHAALRRMIPFWQNLYYQFGLVAMTLHHALRPSVEAEWVYLVACCEKVAMAAQGILYSGAEDFRERYEHDLRTYQDNYNTRPGTLRWFEDDDGNYLHVDISRLDPILTICAMREEKIHKVEQDILTEVFRVEGLTTRQADKHAQALVRDVRKGAPYAELLDDVFRWKWKVNAGAENTYSRIHEEAVKRCGGMDTAPRMMYVEAVNEHRRYDTRGGGSIFL
jgi:hypothetical protein